MNQALRSYLFTQCAYADISKQTGIPEDLCRYEIEQAHRLLNPSGDIILYPERLPWHLIEDGPHGKD
jgi:hypothetical protein